MSIRVLQFTRIFLQADFHARMENCLQEGSKRAPFHEQKRAAKQRKASKMRFMTIECSRSVHSIVLRMARVNGNMSSAALQLILKKTLPL